MAVSFSVSLHTKEKRTEKFKTDAGNVCINYIKDYGSIKWEALDENEYGENKAKLTGLCYVRQMDFNSDGKDELMLCYSSNNVYYLEVWGYKNGDFSRLYKDEANRIRKAIDDVLENTDIKTPDLGGKATSKEYTDEIIKRL